MGSRTKPGDEERMWAEAREVAKYATAMGLPGVEDLGASSGIKHPMIFRASEIKDKLGGFREAVAEADGVVDIILHPLYPQGTLFDN